MSKEMNDSKREQAAGVYLGPSFYGIIQKGTVMTGSYSGKMENLLEAHPFLTGLIVPTSELAEKRKELNRKDSEMAMLYRRAEQVKEGMYV